MKFSLLIASGLVAIVAIVGATASRSYGQGSHQQQQYGSGSSHGCGYDCRSAQTYNSHYEQSGSRSPYGPYHSYAVKPAIYGGYGMYHYKGYARHPLPPQNAHYRKVQVSQYGSGSGQYGMRPVKTLLLAPAYSGSQSVPLYPSAHMSYGAPKNSYPRHNYPKQSYPRPSYPKPSYPKPSYGGHYQAPARHYRPANYGYENQNQHYGGNAYKQTNNGYSKSYSSAGGY